MTSVGLRPRKGSVAGARRGPICASDAGVRRRRLQAEKRGHQCAAHIVRLGAKDVDPRGRGLPLDCVPDDLGDGIFASPSRG